jgi:hypothetical protein
MRGGPIDVINTPKNDMEARNHMTLSRELKI